MKSMDALKRKLIAIMLCLGILISGCASSSAWVKKADLPTARRSLASVAMDGKILAMGGLLSQDGKNTGSSQVDVYDPASNAWAKKADMPAGKGDLAAVESGGKIYTFGGIPSLELPPVATVERYDPANDTWTKLPDMPDALEGMATAQSQGKIIVLGGASYDPLTFEKIAVSTVNEFDPSTQVWSQKADMPTARYALAACVLDGKVFTIGGLVSSFAMATPAIASAAVEAYDPNTGTWSQKASLPVAKWGAAAVVSGGKIYVFGGADSDTGSATSTIFVYDPTLDAWAARPNMPFTRVAMSASEVNGKIYLIGGASSSSPDAPEENTVWEYAP